MYLSSLIPSVRTSFSRHNSTQDPWAHVITIFASRLPHISENRPLTLRSLLGWCCNARLYSRALSDGVLGVIRGADWTEKVLRHVISARDGHMETTAGASGDCYRQNRRIAKRLWRVGEEIVQTAGSLSVPRFDLSLPAVPRGLERVKHHNTTETFRRRMNSTATEPIISILQAIRTL